MSMKTAPDFTRLSNTVMLFDASKTKNRTDDKGRSVSLIVLCTWIGAAPRHAARYTEVYRRLFPDTSLLVIEASLADITYRSQTAQQTSLEPAREVIESHLSDPVHGRILLHAFSNGGAQTATQLAIFLQGKNNDQRGPFDAVILDSCPGSRDPAEAARAITIGLPKTYFIQFIATSCMHIWAILYFSTLDILGIEDAISSTRRRLNDPALFRTSAPRLYLHSRSDQIVGTTAVQEHTRESRLRGYLAVFEVLFETGGHCALILENAQRYWNAVQALVEGNDSDGGRARCVL